MTDRDGIFDDYTGPNPGETPEQYAAYQSAAIRDLLERRETMSKTITKPFIEAGKRIAELRAQNEAMREALKEVAERLSSLVAMYDAMQDVDIDALATLTPEPSETQGEKS